MSSLNTTPPTLGSDNFTNKQYMDVPLYVPKEAISAYQAADNWKSFWSVEAVESTGIEIVKANADKSHVAISDLQGRKLSKPQRGLNIINGKKVLVK